MEHNVASAKLAVARNPPIAGKPSTADIMVGCGNHFHIPETEALPENVTEDGPAFVPSPPTLLTVRGKGPATTMKGEDGY